MKRRKVVKQSYFARMAAITLPETLAKWVHVICVFVILLGLIYILSHSLPVDDLIKLGLGVIISGVVSLVYKTAGEKPLFGNKLWVNFPLAGASTALFLVAFSQFQFSSSTCGVVTKSYRPSNISANEVLVVIADFIEVDDSATNDPDENLAASLDVVTNTLNKSGGTFTYRVERILQSEVRNEEYVDTVSNCLNASIFIWGHVTTSGAWYVYNFYPRFDFDQGIGDQLGIELSAEDNPDRFAIEGGGGEFVLEFTTASLYQYRGDYPNATSMVSRAIELGQMQPSLHEGLYAAYMLRAQIEFRSSRFDLALEDANSAVAMKPERVIGYYNRGIIQAQLGNLDLAIADFTTVIEGQPDAAAAVYLRGKVYQLKHDYGSAIADYNESIRLYPQAASAYYRLGEIYFEQVQPELSLTNLTRAIELDAGSADLFYTRGTVYLYIGNYTAAIEDLTRAITLDPNFVEAYVNRSAAYNFNGDLEKAQADTNLAVALGYVPS